LPGSGLPKAIDSLLRHRHGQTRFLEDPNIPLDNHLAERDMRGVVLGRTNHYGSRAKRGTEVATILYNLTESAKLVGAEPNADLLTATQAALNKPGTVTHRHRTWRLTSDPGPCPSQPPPGPMGSGEDVLQSGTIRLCRSRESLARRGRWLSRWSV